MPNSGRSRGSTPWIIGKAWVPVAAGSPGSVDGYKHLGWSASTCSAVAAAGRIGSSRHAAAGTRRADRDEVVVDVEVVEAEVADVEVTSETDDTPRGAGAAGDAPRPTRRVDGRPETDYDRGVFDLRDAGYRGWIDQDGHAVAASSTGDGPPPRRLTDDEVAAAIAGGGYHPGLRVVPDVEPDGSESEGGAHVAAGAPQSPDGRPAGGSAEHYDQHGNQQEVQQEDQEAQKNDASATGTAILISPPCSKRRTTPQR